MIHYEEKVNGATSSMREGVDKMRGDSPESPQFSACSFAVSRKAKIFFLKISIVRDKMITFAVDKTQLTFFLAVLRRPHSAKSGTFPESRRT